MGARAGGDGGAGGRGVGAERAFTLAPTVRSGSLLRMPRRSSPRRASYRDVLAAPAWVVAEVVDGELRTSPRPSPRHAFAYSRLVGILEPPFGRGVAGPGGWVVLAEPELHFGGDETIVVPDLAAWRIERLATLPDEACFRTPPDWICEILSPSSVAFDRERKLPVYARAGVAHAWLVDPGARTLEVCAADGEGFRVVATHRDDARVRAVPFEAVEFGLGDLWAA